ncbi:carbohydrate-binding protein [Aquimarina algiphila]|uniref:hypothetical protein n=1 Tax=Aquimarina algiphila TaxID=2047982 RepID=UPI00232C8EE6|nr:hypothetical protein [Aquimarina algiphila]
MILEVLKIVLFFKKVKRNAITIFLFCLITMTSIGQQTKYGGGNNMPGVIEAENFDLGGEGAIKGNNGLYVSHNNGNLTGLTCDKSVVGNHEKFIITDLTSE